MEHLPFCVFKRTGRAFYYVKFKDGTGQFGPASSTKQETKAAAIATAYEWLKNGKPTEEGGNASLSLVDALRQVQTAGEAEFVCKELRRRGLLKSFIIAGGKQDVDFPTYLQTFWDYDTSPYVKEKLRKNHGIHKYHTAEQALMVKKYWVPFFKGRLLGSITRVDIESFIDTIADRELSADRKNKIVRAGVIPLRWAFSKEAIDKDLSAGITWFSGETSERKILTPEIAKAVFAVEWKDERARLANLLSAVTGLRAGEIVALQVQDLGKDCLNIRHSWNPRDKLKTTKTNKERVVEIPFSNLIQELSSLAEKNPHGAKADSYIFWAKASAEQPAQRDLFVDGLRDALEKTGMSPGEAKVYVFHSWRHFYTSYMRERLDTKLLQSQTGHKTTSMLEHYSEHRLEGDREKRVHQNIWCKRYNFGIL
ncbi:hypothetical protein FACS1894200_11740 [Spirochaetia bacterium]|nr:hypothetical protein FACS1894200_11740 [Spirochaetia bacterium]